MTNFELLLIIFYIACNFLCAGIYIGHEPDWDFISFIKLLTNFLFGSLMYSVLYFVIGINWACEKLNSTFHIKSFYIYLFTKKFENMSEEKFARFEELVKQFKTNSIRDKIGRYCAKLIKQKNN